MLLLFASRSEGAMKVSVCWWETFHMARAGRSYLLVLSVLVLQPQQLYISHSVRHHSITCTAGRIAVSSNHEEDGKLTDGSLRGDRLAPPTVDNRRTEMLLEYSIRSFKVIGGVGTLRKGPSPSLQSRCQRWRHRQGPHRQRTTVV